MNQYTYHIHNKQGCFKLITHLEASLGEAFQMFEDGRWVYYHPIEIARNFREGPYRPLPRWGPHGIEDAITDAWFEYFHEDMLERGEYGRLEVKEEYKHIIKDLKPKPPYLTSMVRKGKKFKKLLFVEKPQ